jgi:hypothetical protein
MHMGYVYRILFYPFVIEKKEKKKRKEKKEGNNLNDLLECHSYAYFYLDYISVIGLRLG